MRKEADWLAFTEKESTEEENTKQERVDFSRPTRDQRSDGGISPNITRTGLVEA